MTSKSKTLTYNEITAKLKKKEISNAYLFEGEEHYLREDVIQAIKKLLVDDSSRDFNYNVLSANDKDAVREAVEISNTLPLFFSSGKAGIGRLIVLRDIEKLKEADLIMLSGYLSEPSDSTCLILVAGKIDKRKKHNNEIKSKSVHVNFYHLFDNQIPGWVTGKVKEYGRTISTDAVRSLTAEAGSDLQSLNSEIEKLINYTGDRKTIEVRDVEQVLGYVKGISVFDLQKAITYRDVKGALRILNALLKESAYKNQIITLSLIASRLRHLALVKTMLRQGVRGDGIMSRLRLSPFYNRYLIEASVGFTDAELERCFAGVLNTDMEIKTGKKPFRLALEMLVMDICRKNS